MNQQVDEKLKKKASADARNQKLTPEQGRELINTLKSRFEKNGNRHKGLEWSEIEARLNDKKLRSLSEMERTGGEPDVIGFDKNSGEYLFCDCAPESPKGRRSICYDHEGQEEREKNGVHPEGNALDMADSMDIEILNEEQYRELQKLGQFDSKTSSWLKTPPDIRKAGGAIFGDYRYGHVFIYHNSAPSFYSSRGFRGTLRV